jgi:glycine oxidase
MTIATDKREIIVAGAGIVGLWQALLLARSGHHVTLHEQSAAPFTQSASKWAGAMLAPDCEAESAPPIIRARGRDALAVWRATYPDLINRGTLVVANARDDGDLNRFHKMTSGGEMLSAADVGKLEPELSSRVSRALCFSDEAHMDANAAMRTLLQLCIENGVEAKLGHAWDGAPNTKNWTIDCRGITARDDVKGLRGVRGERVLVEAPDVSITRPVRLLHPRQPIYVVPQGNSRYVIGATVIEREDDGPMTIRSALDLLGSAYALHPGFAEAAIIDMGAGLRPAFADNVPKIIVERDERIIRVNGTYRHGFLLAPVLAEDVVRFLATGEQPIAFAA